MDGSASQSVEQTVIFVLLKRGAEAVVSPVIFDGRAAVLKERARKNYRASELDKKLRSQRTRSEAKITGDARRAGIKTAAIYFTDEKNFRIYFEHLAGATLKEEFLKGDKKRVSELAKKWGEITAKLHSAGIVHGDLTTSNLIVTGDDIYVLDFGLAFFSKRDEDAAEDINLLRQAVEAVHSKAAKIIMEYFVKGYSAHQKSDTIIKRTAEIASRGRYYQRKFIADSKV
ncbi:MAG: Kae1-associated serine/threonine protein kinase [Candidatus Aenigmarchaeota archaeon]|nr:Kae1-associated serine/threonine protein kinase [Candidatus Aenigmarchaeota archaeon]